MKTSRQEPWPVQIARLRQQAANERAQLVVHVHAVTGRTAGVRATAGSVLGLADRLLGGGSASALSTFARASVLPLVIKAGSALLHSRLGRLVVVAAAVGGGVWWWRQASRPLPPQESG